MALCLALLKQPSLFRQHSILIFCYSYDTPCLCTLVNHWLVVIRRHCYTDCIGFFFVNHPPTFSGINTSYSRGLGARRMETSLRRCLYVPASSISKPTWCPILGVMDSVKNNGCRKLFRLGAPWLFLSPSRMSTADSRTSSYH